MKIKDYLYITNENIKQLKSSLNVIAATKQQNKLKASLEKAALVDKISKLQFTERITTSDLLSDLRFFRPSFFARIKLKFSSKSLIRCIIHMDNCNDVVRFFPIYRNNVVDINNEYYMFSPDSFRYINGVPTLYFYQGVPMSILHKPRERVPTFDAKAFTSIQKSKFITDALEGEESKISGGLIIAILVITIINLLGLFIVGILILDKLRK